PSLRTIVTWIQFGSVGPSSTAEAQAQREVGLYHRMTVPTPKSMSLFAATTGLSVVQPGSITLPGSAGRAAPAPPAGAAARVTGRAAAPAGARPPRGTRPPVHAGAGPTA